jgi:hypothetical protein
LNLRNLSKDMKRFLLMKNIELRKELILLIAKVVTWIGLTQYTI